MQNDLMKNRFILLVMVEVALRLVLLMLRSTILVPLPPSYKRPKHGSGFTSEW